MSSGTKTSLVKNKSLTSIAMVKWQSRYRDDDLLDIFSDECFLFNLYISCYDYDSIGYYVRMCYIFSMVDAI